MIGIAVGIVTASERERAIAPLVAAFSTDPVMRWLLPDTGQYLETFPEVSVRLGGAAFDHGTAYSTDDFAATALWLPPDASPDEEGLAALMQRSLAPERQEAMFTILGRLAEYHPPEPHWYLPLIGVDPTRQGRGYGSALLERALAETDEAHCPAYLESSNQRNIPLYERFGFQVLGEIRAGDSPPLWPMLRRAR